MTDALRENGSVGLDFEGLSFTTRHFPKSSVYPGLSPHCQPEIARYNWATRIYIKALPVELLYVHHLIFI